VQKVAKEGIQNVIKIGDELGKGLDKLFNKKGGIPQRKSIFDLIQK